MSKNKRKLISILSAFIIMGGIIIPTISSAATYTQSVRSGIDAFPAEYQVYLRKLQETHPNWTFDAYYTGIGWDDLVNNETVCGRNRIYNGVSNPLWKSSCGNVATGYACASEAIIKYYMDPRNLLKDDVRVFQFLEISYNEKIHTIEGINSTVANSFLNATITFNLNGQSKTMTYAQIILEAAKASQMSPYSIATKIIQEVGSKGSASVSGTYPGYEGYYNFYNYGASDGGSPIAKGLQYAKDHGWNNQYTAIVEGAKLLANSYTNAGQNTAYFYKWDVVGTKILKAGQTQQVSSSNMFWHQYMSNIQDPTSQSSTTYRTYNNNGIINEKLNFVIPVYENMPATNKLPTSLTTADGALYYMTGTDVRVRQEPNTSSSALYTMTTLDEIVAVLERKCSVDSSGRAWDRVKLSNGIVGYIASEYLAPCEKEVSVMAQIQGDIAKAVPNVTVGGIAYYLGLGYYEVMKDGVRIAEEKPVGTGYILKDTKAKKDYTIVVPGDLNGDGLVNTGDSFLIKQVIMEVKELSGDAYKKAADINGDGLVNTGDSFILKKYIMETGNIKL